jgi:uncharacterized SAM-binding protein YcdF (DUF218 family)
VPNPDLIEVTAPADPGVADAVDARQHARRHARPCGRRRVRWGRVALGVVAVIVGYYVVSLFQVWRAGQESTPAPASADVIVVLGAAQYDGRPSPQLAARLDHGLALWQDGVAPLIMVTGGKQPGDRFTEADAGFEYLVGRGVPAEAIRREDVGRTTYESLAAAADVLAVEQIDRVVLVTDPFHSLRTRLIADEVGLVGELSPTPSSVVTGWSSFRRQVFEAGGVAVGRLVGFDRLSDLTG